MSGPTEMHGNAAPAGPSPTDHAAPRPADEGPGTPPPVEALPDSAGAGPELSMLRAANAALAAELARAQAELAQMREDRDRAVQLARQLRTAMGAQADGVSDAAVGTFLSRVDPVAWRRIERMIGAQASAVRASRRYLVGSALIEAVQKPGRNTLMLPVRMVRALKGGSGSAG